MIRGLGPGISPLPLPSPVEPFRFRNRDFFVKRDERIEPRFSGNKFRKLYTLFRTPPNRYHTLVSYGGIQSNAMLSLAHLAAMKGWRFRYLAKTPPSWLREKPEGNYAAALALGMEAEYVEHGRFYERVEELKESVEEGTLFVPQGGAAPMAAKGVRVLAEEIVGWMETSGLRICTVATPSGTGTTALYLRKFLPPSVAVATAPAVGDGEVLRAQWRSLDPEAPHPLVLERMGKIPFAKPMPEFLSLWRELKEAGIEFDLLYAPRMWLELLKEPSLPGPLLYVHSGGVSGNESQLAKYRRKGML